MPLHFYETRNRKNFEIFGELGEYFVKGICASRSTRTMIYFPDLIFTHRKSGNEVHIHPVSGLISFLQIVPMKNNPEIEKLTFRGVAFCTSSKEHTVGWY
ncbi:hypothetical protein [Shimazuella alba]|uniref:Uncharacterized protein n=1 Tax=Shimazuella alba TaxID=2690964 RepID=A0A6I4VW58_9BACL|nr:hypothetical protein [Shimazuella alba]MXQ55163.1 hypothetical protein [Shimazuella alba]